MADAVKSAGAQLGNSVTRPTVTRVTAPGTAVVASSSSSKPPLTVPIINPAIKTILSKLNTGNQPLQQTPAGNRIILNAAPISSTTARASPTDNSKQTVKLIAVNPSSSANSSGRIISFFINSSFFTFEDYSFQITQKKIA